MTRHPLRAVQPALDALPLPLAVLDADGTVLLVNRSFRRLAGARAPLLANAGVGLPCSVCCGEVCGTSDERAEELAAELRRLAGHPQRELSQELASRQGDARFQVRAAGWRLSGFALTLVVVEHLDEHDAARGEQHQRLLEEIRAGRALLATVLQQVPLGVLVAEAGSGQVLLANEQVEEITGWPATSLLSRVEPATPFHVDGRLLSAEDAPLARALRGEAIAAETLELRRGDGGWAVLQASAGPVYNELGQTIAAVLVLLDVSATHQLRERLRDREAQLRAILDHAPVGIAILDWDGYVLHANLALERLLGYSLPELRSLRITELAHPAEADLEARLLEAVRRGERVGFRIRRRYVHRSGRIVPARLHAVVVPNATGAPAYLIGIIHRSPPARPSRPEPPAG